MFGIERVSAQLSAPQTFKLFRTVVRHLCPQSDCLPGLYSRSYIRAPFAVSSPADARAEQLHPPSLYPIPLLLPILYSLQHSRYPRIPNTFLDPIFIPAIKSTSLLRLPVQYKSALSVLDCCCRCLVIVVSVLIRIWYICTGGIP